MVLTTPPPEAPSGIEVRRVETFDDFLASRDVQWEAFDVPQERRELQRAAPALRLRRVDAARVPVGFLAYLDGKPAATGLAIPSARGVFLIAGSTAALGARPRRLSRARPRPLGLRRRAGHAGARHRGDGRHVVPDPAAARLHRGLHDLAPRGDSASSLSGEDGAGLVEPAERVDDRRVELRARRLAQPAHGLRVAAGGRGRDGRSSSRGTRRRRARCAPRSGCRAPTCRPGSRAPSQRSWHARTIGRTSASRSIGSRIFSPSSGCSLTISNSSSVERARLLQDLGRDPDLADVVEERAELEPLHRVAVEARAPCRRAATCR